jgi:glycosyltransferase involved in cell wall biosynthesis
MNGLDSPAENRSEEGSQRLHILYAIQNVGGIDFSQDIGDTVPVKQSLVGLKHAGHIVDCLRLEGNRVAIIKDVTHPDQQLTASLGISGHQVFRSLEGVTRRIQRVLKVPYFAIFDSFRFYEACYRSASGYDLIHEHNGLFCLGTAWACTRSKMPYVLTFSADPILERELVGKPLTGIHAWVARKEARFTYQAANRILCVSEPAKSHLVNTWQVDEAKIVVMPNGVDTQLFRPLENSRLIRTQLGLDGQPVVSFVGSFQLWHGIERLVESFAWVLRDIPQARLLLVGDGPARPVVEDTIKRLELASRVTITGLVPQVKIPEILAAVDVAVIPYPALPKDLWFSPLKLYEYMAAGKAIVASASGQIAEVVRDGYNGLLVEPGDVQETAQAITRLLKNPAEMEWLGKNARRQAVDRHSWSGYIRNLENVYQEAIDENNLKKTGA